MELSGLVAAIVVVILCMRKGVNIGVAMFLGGTALGLVGRIGILPFLQVLYKAIFSGITVFLVVSIVLIGVLGHIMKETGSLDKMINPLARMMRDLRLVASVLPLFVGMLPVPGGAVLSAPMLDEVGDRIELTNNEKSTVNILFRHLFYFMFPLFPSMILAAQLASVNIYGFVRLNLLITVLSFVFSFFYIFKWKKQGGSLDCNTVLPKSGFEGTCNWGLELRRFLQSIFPLLVVLLLALAFDLSFAVALVVGVMLALVNYIPLDGDFLVTFLKRARVMILPGVKFSIVFTIMGIMFFKGMLEHTGVVFNVAQFLIGMGIPLLLLLTVVPFLVGLLTGDNTASVGILFPIFLPLIGVGVHQMAYLAYLYVSSTSGHIISPAHPCFAVTREYFKADNKEIIKQMFLPLTVVMMMALVITYFRVSV
jgi:integral membrane protein (TIGR00529 family)